MAFSDLTGVRFGRLVALKLVQAGKSTKWLCRCDCGKTTIKWRGDLQQGKAKSCGCLRSELLAEKNTRHGGANRCERDRLYGVWKGMKQRCLDERHEMYKHYGGRGITVCEEWKKDYSAFRKWALDNGYDETAPFSKCTIDRIDVNGNYEPGNCRWVDMKTQAQNRRPHNIGVTL